MTYADGRGFAMLEVIVAVLVFMIMVGGAFTLIARNVSTIDFLEHRVVAAGLAQEGIEVVQAIQHTNFLHARVTGISTFKSNGLDACSGSSGCRVVCVSSGAFPACNAVSGGLIEVKLAPSGAFLNYDPVTGVYSEGGAGAQSLYQRKIVITEPASAECPIHDCLHVVSEVTWSERGVDQRVRVETRIYNWLGI